MWEKSGENHNFSDVGEKPPNFVPGQGISKSRFKISEKSVK